MDECPCFRIKKKEKEGEIKIEPRYENVLFGKFKVRHFDFFQNIAYIFS